MKFGGPCRWDNSWDRIEVEKIALPWHGISLNPVRSVGALIPALSPANCMTVSDWHCFSGRYICLPVPLQIACGRGRWAIREIERVVRFSSPGHSHGHCWSLQPLLSNVADDGRAIMSETTRLIYIPSPSTAPSSRRYTNTLKPQRIWDNPTFSSLTGSQKGYLSHFSTQFHVFNSSMDRVS